MSVTLREQVREAVLRAWQHPVNHDKMVYQHPDLVEAIVLEVYVSLRAEPESNVTASRYSAYLIQPVLQPLSATMASDLGYDFVELTQWGPADHTKVRSNMSLLPSTTAGGTSDSVVG